MVKEIYKKYRANRFLEEALEGLLRWNRSWASNRDINVYLVTEANLMIIVIAAIDQPEKSGKQRRLNGSQDSIILPMWDWAIFDEKSHRLLLADVNLMSLYINLCLALSEIAGIPDKTEIFKELIQRAKKYSQNLQTLWDDKLGLYLNEDLLTGKLSCRLAPTLFYPLLARVTAHGQLERMIKEYFYNPEEFWGEYILSSIA